jgi:hypothetical protein
MEDSVCRTQYGGFSRRTFSIGDSIWETQDKDLS